MTIKPAKPARSADQTRTAILDAAETLFGLHGYEGTGVRAICRAANMQLGHVTYHWGTKEAMFRAVLDRRLRPVMEARIERLDAVAVAAGGEPATYDILKAYYGPLIELSQRDDSGAFMRFMLRTITDPSSEVQRGFLAITDEATMRFTRLLRRACSHLDEETFLWRLSVTMGGMVWAGCNRPAIERLRSGTHEPLDAERGSEECMAGLAALLDAPPLMTGPLPA